MKQYWTTGPLDGEPPASNCPDISDEEEQEEDALQIVAACRLRAIDELIAKMKTRWLLRMLVVTLKQLTLDGELWG